MASDIGVQYNLKLVSRALVASPNRESNRWLVGTTSLREDNEIRVLSYDTEQDRVVSVASFLHAPEVWAIVPGKSEDRFITIWARTGTFGASLWHASSSEAASSSSSPLQHQCEFMGHNTPVRSALWHTAQEQLALTIEEGGIHKWDVTDEGGITDVGFAASSELLQLWDGTFHPSDPHVAVTCGGHNIQIWDLRTMQMTAQTSGAHRMTVRDVSFAPRSEHVVVSGGDDCKLKLWDTRMISKGADALLELGGHSHWVFKSQFNPQYDQLLASSSSDSLVNLYLITGTMSAVSTTEDQGQHVASSHEGSSTGGRGGDMDGKVFTFDDHEDSVYGLAWSHVDPWLLASLSYDGRFAVNKVPKSVKYNILL
jgi:WD40 repeat protein